VPRALRDSYEISPETKNCVEMRRKIKLQDNPIALSLKEKKKPFDSCAVCEIGDSFFSRVIDGIKSIA
jgi:DNA-binding LacI/PurR family transcriptional regulator